MKLQVFDACIGRIIDCDRTQLRLKFQDSDARLTYQPVPVVLGRFYVRLNVGCSRGVGDQDNCSFVVNPQSVEFEPVCLSLGVNGVGGPARSLCFEHFPQRLQFSDSRALIIIKLYDGRIQCRSFRSLLRDQAIFLRLKRGNLRERIVSAICN